MNPLKSLFIILSLMASTSVGATTYLTEQEFLAQAFSEQSASGNYHKNTLWLDESIQGKIAEILSHPYPKLRIKYWSDKNKTVWILEEVGKTKPITFGFVVNNNQVELARVLVFRESRGYEIANQSFYQQFKQTSLNQDNQLDKHIDGISGATMSVSAMKKIAKVALMLHKEVMK